MILKPMGKPGEAPTYAIPWTIEEDELVIGLYGTMTIREITTFLPRRTFNAVNTRIGVLRQLYPDRMECIKRPYSLEEDKFIRDNCQTMTVKEIAGHLNRSPKSVELRGNNGLNISFYKCGERSVNAKYADDIVIRTQELRDDLNLTFVEIERRLGLPKATARRLYHRRLTADYAISRQYMPR
ncbi:hypothetical protein FPE89_01325 [Salmonella enterica subsp. diarizonae]|nr:hypothetical protein [Salmonella enterica subsp. diarizonae]